jgi:hypothetical protein
MHKISFSKVSVKQLLLLPLSALLIFYSQASYAQLSNCSVVSTKTLFLKKDEFNVLLKFGPNIANEGYYSWIYNKRMMLAPGKHRIKAKAIGQGHRGNSEMTLREGILDSKGKGAFEFELDFEAGYIYRLVAQEIKSSTSDGQSSFKIKVKSKKPQECFHKEKDIIPVHPSVNIDEGTEKIGKHKSLSSDEFNDLPADLQYRLDLLTKDLRGFYKRKGIEDKTVSLVQKRRVSNKLGIVTDSKSKIEKGILVVAVSPFSFAAQIGISAGDQIVGLKINGVNRNKDEFESNGQISAIAALKLNLNNLMPEDSILFKIRRAGKLQNLEASYESISLPAFQLNVELN